MRRTVVTGAAVLALLAATVTIALAQIERFAPAEDVTLYLISPFHGEVIEGPVLVRFGVRGMGVAPAGIDHPNTGHHHLLIDLPLDEVDLDQPLPFTDQTRHLGGGQTEVVLELEPGTYTLQALFADFRHIPFDPVVVSEVITIHVR
jgi:hypothetical protein